MALLAHAAWLAVLCCSAGAAQQPVRLDLDLEIEAEAPPYGDRGPCTSLGHVTSADGQLFVWAESEALDPFLAIESADGSLKVSDDNLGGGTTAWLRVTVKAGTELEIVVAGPDARAVGPVRVHLREMSENAASKEARGALESALLEAALLEARGDLLGARSRVAPAAAKLLAVGGIELDAAAHGVLWRAGESLLNWGAREQSLEILQALVRFADGRYPPLSRARLQPMAALCGVLGELGRSAEALPWCEACVSLADRGFGEHSIEAAAARHNLGLTLLVGGDLEGAAPLIRAAAATHARAFGPDDPRTAQAQSSLGSLLYQLGELEESRRLEEQAVRTLSRTLAPTDPQLLAALTNLASTLDALGDDRTARAMHQRVLDTQRTQYEPLHPELLRSRHNVAVCRLRLGELEAVQKELTELREAYREAGLASSEGAELCDAALGEVRNRMGLHREALAVVLEREDQRARAGRRDPVGEWRLAAVRAHALEALGEFEAALVQAERALAATRLALPPENPDLAEVQMQVARLCARLGRGTRAAELSELALADARGYFARCAMTLSISEAEATQVHWSRLVSDGLALLELTGGGSQRDAAAAQAFELVESARAIGVALLACSHSPASQEIEPMRRKLRSQAREVVRLAAAGESAAALEQAMAAKERTERELRAALSASAGDRLADLQPSVAAVQRELAKDEALVAYWRFDRRDPSSPVSTPREPRLLAFVVRAGQPVSRLDLGLLPPITAAAEAWRRAILQGRSDGDAEERRCGEALRRLVVDPLAESIGTASRVRVALDDVLHLIPLDALPVGDRRLGDRWQMVLPPAGARGATRLPAKESPIGALVAVGGVDYEPEAEEGPAVEARESLETAGRPGGAFEGLRFPRLEGTTAEVEALAALLRTPRPGEPESSAAPTSVILLSGRSATRSALASAAAGAGVLHVATHGFFLERSEDPSGARTGAAARLAERSPLALCGLALAGSNSTSADRRAEGMITAEELATLDLSRCRLVVLSACDTNLGTLSAGQGVASFQKALHAAGAATVVTSLWKVSDETTRGLMLSFYRHVWFEGLSPEEALWRAKSERVAGRSPVRDWAGWVLSRR